MWQNILIIFIIVACMFFHRSPHPPPAWRKQNRLRLHMQRLR